jgi:MinD-like ATPase involved in chromosome partitioning or flagellar assembly
MSNFVVTNHHIVVTSQEQEAIVNALAFFDWMFYQSIGEEGSDWSMKDWKDVAKEYPSDLMDKLATKVATSN